MKNDLTLKKGNIKHKIMEKENSDCKRMAASEVKRY